MFFANSVIGGVEEVARITYISRTHCLAWNKNLRDGELRLLTGWAWSARDHSAYRQGFKTYSAAIRDAHYALVEGRDAPFIRRSHGLRLVKKAEAA